LWIKGKAVLPFDIEKFASEIVAKTKLKSERALELACRANGWATKKKTRKIEKRSNRKRYNS